MKWDYKIERIPECGCWIWVGAIHRNGYGNVHLSKPRRNAVAHRAVYEHLVGPIPNGLELDHLCRVRCCVNPAHLEPVTQKENAERCGSIAALAESVKRRHEAPFCSKGHAMTPDNTYTYPNGLHRQCRECSRIYQRQWGKSRKEAAQ